MEQATYFELVLQGVFWHLVKHKGLSLGIRDFTEALTALRAGYGLGSRDELLWLCQALWARNQEEERIIELLFRHLPTPTSEEVSKAFPQQQVYRNDDFITEKKPPQSKSGSEKQIQEESNEAGLDLSSNIQFVGSTEEGLGLPRANINSDPLETFILAERDIIPLRNLIIIWRRFRKALRTGPKLEIDVNATLDLKCRTGLLTSPVLIPARRNQARLTILIDVKGSMLPWHRFNRVLLESLHQSQLGHVRIYYFQNIPEKSLYLRETLTRPQSLPMIKQSSPDTALMIFSDAGAARRQYNVERIYKTEHFLNSIADIWHPVAWINPLPRSRWRNTTAEAISKLNGLTMFELSENGMTDAIDLLRGYRDFG